MRKPPVDDYGLDESMASRLSYAACSLVRRLRDPRHDHLGRHALAAFAGAAAIALLGWSLL